MIRVALSMGMNMEGIAENLHMTQAEHTPDKENVRLRMIPSLECEVQADLVTDLGSYSCVCEELRHEFIRLCEEGLRLAKEFRREDVLQEGKPKQMLELYYEHSQ